MLNKVDSKNCKSPLGIVEIDHFLIKVEILNRGNFLYSQMNVEVLKEILYKLGSKLCMSFKGNSLNY